MKKRLLSLFAVVVIMTVFTIPMFANAVEAIEEEETTWIICYYCGYNSAMLSCGSQTGNLLYYDCSYNNNCKITQYEKYIRYGCGTCGMYNDYWGTHYCSENHSLCGRSTLCPY